jgi:sulfur carrier protein
MDITVNQESYSVSQNCSLQQMLCALFPELPTGIALAVDQEIIPKAGWDSYTLQPGNNITLIKATQGG